ncbi:hypothetical protein BJX61DRAFT_551360 [Aspergillus egyptiacus]|nr:hypothetical protein BJX61DRAFT_551360 [Aspergillus egyptiacus]
MAPEHTLPPVPVKHSEFLDYVKANPEKPIPELVKPYNEYDAVLRRIYAQEPDHPAVADNVLNMVPLFDANGCADIHIRARDLASETEEVKSKYLMPLKDEQRKATGALAVVSTLKEFQAHFNIFSESSLSELDWNNVVAAGSAVSTCILPVPAEYNDSKRGLRQFYHEKFAPASDVDLFLYGLTEEEAIEKIKQIERCIRDSILTEISVIRTKHAITIVSQYPTRHVQIVLRRYASVAEILTGFDVDCSCAAYDGSQVYLAPRAVGAYITQINQVDLTRRSPSYENRLSKYSHRGFEVLWPDLDRSRIDPSIFERSFTRTVGLARLLVLEKLPKSSDRERYLEQRRRERGRPQPYNSYRFTLYGNIKDDWQDEVAEWVEEEEVSDYHTFTIPYGPKFHARKIEKLLYTKDLLLNAEWNKPKDREVNLHRHPAFFGSAEDVMHDCCGYCPKPTTPEEEEVAAEESKIYISGEISFLSDNPGRQEIGSFNPITDTDWTEMAYVGNTEGLCQAIVDNDVQEVQRWLNEDSIDVNRRDHTGRSPLHLACMTSTPEIVQCLVDKGARLIARVADGRTALHLAAARGSAEIIRILLTKSEQNEEEEARKEARKESLRREGEMEGTVDENSDEVLVNESSDDDDEKQDATSYATGSFVKIAKEQEEQSTVPDDAGALDPDIYDINVLAWDSKASPLHLAILNGNVAAVEELVASFGADVLLPVKLVNPYDNSPRSAILTLVLALLLPKDSAKAMTAKLLQLGASPAQADIHHKTALHYLAHLGDQELLDVYKQYDQPGLERAINYVSARGSYYSFSVESPLTLAIAAGDEAKAMKLLEMGARPMITREDFTKAANQHDRGYYGRSSQDDLKKLQQDIPQVIILALEKHMISVALELLARGADPNTLTPQGYQLLWNTYSRGSMSGSSILDYVREQLRVLRKYKGVEEIEDPRSSFLEPDDDTYLQGLQNDSYALWYAKTMLKTEREGDHKRLEKYQKEIERMEKGEGLQEKKAAIAALVGGYEKLEADLLSRGAKPFEELHPEIESFMQPPGSSGAEKPEPYKISFDFRIEHRICRDEEKDGYLQLFNAAWSGDIDVIKSLTLSPWGPEKKVPLEVGVTDFNYFSPFSVAILRGHYDAAKAILAISMAQYKPGDNDQKTRYRMRLDYDSDGSDADSEDIRLDSHVIDGQYTIENIGEAKSQVESWISPETVLTGICKIDLFLETSQCPEFGIANLLQYAIWKDDLDLLNLLISMGQELLARRTDGRQSSVYTLGSAEFSTALELGRLRCLEVMIKRTGAGLPLDKLAESSGVVLKEKPKYYQGLSVHGKKRADWAAAGGMPVEAAMHMSPPLLRAAKLGNLATVEWFLGTAPGRYYLEFAKAHKKDPRLKKLALTERGMEQSILDWLGSRRDLVLHCAVLSSYTEESHRLVEYLVENMPHCLEVKSSDEYTPLAVAFKTHKVEFAKILINAGANQAARFKEGMNLIHLLVSSFNGYHRKTSFADMLGLINPLLIPSMLIERCSAQPGSLTPLALGMSMELRNAGESPVREAFQAILDLADATGQKHLELFDGSGNTPLHTAVNCLQLAALEAFLERRPDLLHRENAVGVTPAELAESRWVTKMTEDPPSDPDGTGFRSYRRVDVTARDIVQKDPQHFVGKPAANRATETDVHSLCRAKREESVGMKRKLVSLFDANEVAKRLASNENAPWRSRHRRYRRHESDEDEDEDDEVSQWL